MAKPKGLNTTQMNVRVPSSTLKQARQIAKKAKLRLGQIVDAALIEYLRMKV